MKVSLNLAQYYSEVDLKSIPREELLTRIGAQLGAVEEVIDWAPKYEGAVIVKVVECEKHPNADKLHVCRVDDGGVVDSIERDENGLVQVVCGAPNVHADMLAVWLPPGTTVPVSRDKDPFVLTARDIRGQISNGMLASAHELGVSDDHSGILAIDEDVSVGTAFSTLYGLDDLVIDIENKMFTHRPDCFGTIGVARELAGILDHKFQSPLWYTSEGQSDHEVASTLKFSSQNEIPELVPRFAAQVVEDVKVAPSPPRMQALLNRLGVKPINNLVDWSNHFMLQTAQPTHAFDYDKLKTLSDGEVALFPRLARRGEKLTLLGGKTIELHEDDIVIATNKQPVALAGIMGGAETEVDGNTKNIIIECATFDMYSIRRSSMRHGLFTDASTRFAKGQSPLQNVAVLSKVVDEITTLDGGKPGMTVDLGSFGNKPEVLVSVDFINARLGTDLSTEQITRLLNNVEIPIKVDGNNLLVGVPFWRTDIEIPEDIVEEVGRLYGYDRLPVALPPRTVKPTPRNALSDFKMHLGHTLKEAGGSEVLTYSFVHGDLLRNTGTDPEATAYHLRNAISPDLQYYRTSLIPSLLSKVHPNIKAQAGRDDNAFAIFEIGKTHVRGVMDESEPSLPAQLRRLAMIFAADGKITKTFSGAPYYQARRYLTSLSGGQAEFAPVDDFNSPLTSAFAPGRSAYVLIDGELIGVIGEFALQVRKSFKLPSFCSGFELDIDRLQTHLKPGAYKSLPDFPSIYQDVTLKSGKEMSWAHVQQMLDAELAVASAENGYVSEISPLDIFRSDGSSETNMSFRVELTHPSRTLTTQETSNLLDEVTSVLSDKYGIGRV